MHQALSKMHEMFADVRELTFLVLIVKSMFENPQNNKYCYVCFAT
jgi:hypothetical protein